VDYIRLKPQDALVCAGYKWLMGPYGSSATIFKSELTTISIGLLEPSKSPRKNRIIVIKV